MENYDRAKMLRRRVYQKTLHLSYLETVALEPESIDSEIERHQACIDELHVRILEHVNRINEMQQTRATVYLEIEKCENALKYLREEHRKLLVDELLRQYQEINKRLERTPEC